MHFYDDVGGAPRLDAAAVATEQKTIADILNPRYVASRQTKFSGHVWDVVRERVSLDADGDSFDRDFLLHPGAVAVAVLNDQNQILLINQYRHPVRANLWEVPAGLLDVEGEAPVDAAARELAEETFLRASHWATLMEFYNSPGGTGEVCRIFVARGIEPIAPSERELREREESEIVMRWVNIDEAVEAVLTGRVHNAAATNAILAVSAALDRGLDTLYPADAPFRAHPAFRSADFRGELRPAEGS